MVSRTRPKWQMVWHGYVKPWKIKYLNGFFLTFSLASASTLYFYKWKPVQTKTYSGRCQSKAREVLPPPPRKHKKATLKQHPQTLHFPLKNVAYGVFHFTSFDAPPTSHFLCNSESQTFFLWGIIATFFYYDMFFLLYIPPFFPRGNTRLQA